MTELRLPATRQTRAVPWKLTGAPRPVSRWRTSACPVYKSEISIPTANVVGGDNANVDVRLSFLSGGPASGDIVTVRRDSTPAPPGFDSLPDYSFSVYQDDESGGRRAVAPSRKVRTRPVMLSNAGAARVTMATPGSNARIR